VLRRGRLVGGDRTAVVCGDVRLTHAELADRTCRLGDALARRGLAPGDRVAVLATNCHRYLELYLGLPAAGRYAGLLCRGVLNDLLDGRSRQEVFHSFARALSRGGALVLDVREWEASARRKIREPVFEKTVETPRGSLTFRSVTRVDPGTRRLLVEERHTLKERSGAESVAAYDFQMRCWTREELEARLTRAGFGGFEFFGAYDANSAEGTSDRLVCVASRA